MNAFIATAKKFLPEPIKNALRRAIFPLRNRGLFKPYVIKKDMEGVTFDFLIGDRTGRDWYDLPCINNPVWLEMRFIKEEMARPGDVILEVGGHHGCSAILLSSWVGSLGRIVTFEPFPSNCAILEQNIQLNSLKNVTLERQAVGAEAGEIVIDESTSGVATSGNGTRTRVTNLDQFANLRPTFLKIDVEGFEQRVLEGAREVLKGCPKLAIEIHPAELGGFGGSVPQIFALIQPERYTMWIQRQDDVWPEPFDPSTPITTRAHLFCLPRA